MSLNDSIWIPGSTFPCVCGRPHSIATFKVETGQGAFGHMEGFLKASLPEGGCVLAIYDRNTYDVASARLRAALGPLPLREFVFKRSHGELPADMDSLAELEGELKAVHPSLTLAVGSGVISDLVKVAADSLQIPYVSVPTAPSMDGYLSANAALLSGGMKRQFNGLRPPLALFSETGIVMSAPDRMIRAGLGDALGKFTSLAEWMINRDVRGEYHCPEAARMLEGEILGLLASAESEDLRSTALVERLMRVLLATGIAMQATGTSACASCGEHYISHAMEMRGYAVHGHAPSFHGLQVAFGAKTVIDAYKQLSDGSADGRKLDFGAMRKIYSAHASDWLAIGVDVSQSIEDKMKLLESLGGRLDFISSCSGAVSWLLDHAGRLEAVYKRHALPSTPAELGLAREDALFAVRHAVDIRQRICVLDLLHCLGAMDLLESKIP